MQTMHLSEGWGKKVLRKSQGKFENNAYLANFLSIWLNYELSLPVGDMYSI